MSQCTVGSVALIGPLGAPTGVNGTPFTSGGSIATGTWYAKVTATNSIGEGLPSAESSAIAVTGPNGRIELVWAAVANATGYNVYLTQTSGVYGASSFKASSGTNSLSITTSSLSAGQPPSLDTSASDIVNGVGTSWATAVAVGNLFKRRDETVIYQVSQVISDTQLRLSARYGGATGTGILYMVSRDFTSLGLVEFARGVVDWPDWFTYNMRRVNSFIESLLGALPSLPFTQVVNAGDVQAVIDISAFGLTSTDYSVVALADWTFGCKLKRASKTVSQFILEFQDPAPSGGGSVDGLIGTPLPVDVSSLLDIISLGVVRGVQSVTLGGDFTTITFSGPMNTVYAFDVIPNWNTTCWYDESSIGAGTITIYFSTPAPANAKIKWFCAYF